MTSNETYPFTPFDVLDFPCNQGPSVLRILKKARDTMICCHPSDPSLYARQIAKFEKLSRRLPRETIELHLYAYLVFITKEAETMLDVWGNLAAELDERHVPRAAVPCDQLAAADRQGT